jgi:hypothetical protein
MYQPQIHLATYKVFSKNKARTLWCQKFIFTSMCTQYMNSRWHISDLHTVTIDNETFVPTWNHGFSYRVQNEFEMYVANYWPASCFLTCPKEQK